MTLFFQNGTCYHEGRPRGNFSPRLVRFSNAASDNNRDRRIPGDCLNHLVRDRLVGAAPGIKIETLHADGLCCQGMGKSYVRFVVGDRLGIADEFGGCYCPCSDKHVSGGNRLQPQTFDDGGRENLVADQMFRVPAADEHKKKNRICGGGDLKETSREDHDRERCVALDRCDLFLKLVRHHEAASDKETVDSGFRRAPDKRREVLVVNLIGIDENQVPGAALFSNRQETVKRSHEQSWLVKKCSHNRLNRTKGVRQTRCIFAACRGHMRPASPSSSNKFCHGPNDPAALELPGCNQVVGYHTDEKNFGVRNGGKEPYAAAEPCAHRVAERLELLHGADAQLRRHEP